MAAGDFARLVTGKEIVLVVGPGGVGKTTIAAATAVHAARAGRKVLVMTIDPARRLADVLGVDGIGDDATLVSAHAWARAGLDCPGELWTSMLDTKAAWDALVHQHAPDAETADAILANPLYDNVTSRFVHSHEYIAMERLHELHASGRYDLIVVDTPPSRNAVDFLEAPSRMAEFFGGRLVRWLTAPARSRLVGAASRPFLSIAHRILGSQFVGDIAEFFLLFQTMYDGFVDRADSVRRTLREQRSTFVVVSSLEAAALREAERLLAELGDRDLQAGALVLNRELPAGFRNRRAATAARRLVDSAEGLAAPMAAALDPSLEPGAVRSVLEEVGRSHLRFRTVAEREAELRSELTGAPDIVRAVPYLAEAPVDLALLDAVAGHLRS